MWTQQDSDYGNLPDDKEVGDVKVEGLKTQLIRKIKQQAAGILQDTDWYIIRKADAGTEENPVMERPLGELPTLEI